MSKVKIESTEVKVRPNYYESSFDFAIVQRLEGVRYVAKTVEMKALKTSDNITPAFTLTEEETQGLFNYLWHLGFRPEDGTGNSGHIAAIKYHLEDMRKLVFIKCEEVK